MIFFGYALIFSWYAWQAPSYESIEAAILFTPLLAYIALWKLWLPIFSLPYWDVPSMPRGVVTKVYCRSTGVLLTSEAIPRQCNLNWPDDIFTRGELEELLRASQSVLASHKN